MPERPPEGKALDELRHPPVKKDIVIIYKNDDLASGLLNAGSAGVSQAEFFLPDQSHPGECASDGIVGRGNGLVRGRVSWNGISISSMPLASEAPMTWPPWKPPPATTAEKHLP